MQSYFKGENLRDPNIICQSSFVTLDLIFVPQDDFDEKILDYTTNLPDVELDGKA